MMDGTLFEFINPAARAEVGLPLIADSFAGGGGASTGIEMALGRSPDVAINHDPVALSMHEANHPTTRHLTNSVYAIDPADLPALGQRVGLAWFSPDCKHHSKAKGGKPLDANIRDLAWVVIHWAERVRPDVIFLENVEEWQKWGPLTPDNKPDPERSGDTFREWLRRLRRLKYKVEWKELVACDYGAPTIRKRLYLIARCDGLPIVWPTPTHGAPNSAEVLAGTRKPWRTAAEIIDWSLPCPSIFDTSAEIMQKHGLRAIRPLAENTLRRVALGVQKYVIDAADPFFVTYGQHGGAVRSGFDPMHTITASLKDQNQIIVPSFQMMRNSKSPTSPADKPLRTITAGGAHPFMVAPSLVQVGYGEAPNQAPRVLDLHKPLGTVVAGGSKHALVAAFLAQHNTGVIGRRADAPLSTVTTRGTQQNVVAAHMVNMHGTGRSARDARDPVTSICAGETTPG
ncbi:DNA cytosine methyltransferase [Pseudosulfitobacter pseudonitzschiae]|uniref:DNA cytosine methyltransferase n=2 Tax=Pseudosulfitobacter pseudonitzschiae TaxID=1402135 RepID=UPI001CCE49DF|nr:DNA cytosine methyltransferase [Pseudosulfitobacter pseudonitzschiae]MCD2326396.1 DNA cytosine methyltransferase [Pseudosulfitobacter pseudonitzschiae]MCD2349983.1 DNA cytosine methyltransferase [Pseudosulfitobacter pseudonitzschiae]UFE34670.1 DNA cytosine methyltransferase [Pseudosulfitobacter pseudonitzschiae]UFE36633.1 DNA cytosine methyltransferase [Pseudosulfitobacter pseudonitzschiae]UFE60038.1 DNA cytosine methyltransferase [Pseudosulfitobacter pseudonitzschiae]